MTSSSDDTIVAVATGTGNAAIGVVRISGSRTAALLELLCRIGSSESVPDFRSRPRQALLCSILDRDGDPIDTGLVTYFPAPASYTGEDVAELALHGNNLLLRRCVDALVSPHGPAGSPPLARPAEPGEFTRRAFLNGKLDLSQAEAVRRIIEAKSEYELRAGRRLLTGQLSRLVSRFRSALISLKAETEAEVDFSTEDLTFESRTERLERVRALVGEIEGILERAAGTTRAASGFQIALMGVPNAGKSSLLNQMLGWERAIVSDVPGTTRDYLAEEIQFEGVSVRFVDTAGLRDTNDSVEAEGVRRSHSEIQRSQIVLHVIDGARPAYQLPELPPGKGDPLAVFFVINKSDALNANAWRPSPDEKNRTLSVSCLTGDGLPVLRDGIKSTIASSVGSTDPLLLEDRHRFHFEATRAALENVVRLMGEEAPAEIIALEIDTALHHTGAITGRITEEEILGRIFSTFCVGK